MQQYPNSLPGFFWHYLKPFGWQFSLLVITMLGSSIQEGIYPYFVKQIIEGVNACATDRSQIFNHLSSVLTALVVLWILIEIGYRSYDFLSKATYPKFQAKVRMSLFEYTQFHSHQYFSDNLSGTIASKITRMPEAMLEIIKLSVTTFIPTIMTFIIGAIVLYQASAFFSILMLGWFSLHMGITLFFTRKCSLLSRKHSEAQTILNGKIVDAFINIINIRMFARFQYEKAYLMAFQNQEQARHEDLLRYNALMKVCLGLACQTFIFLMIGMAIYDWRIGKLSAGDLALVLSSLSMIGHAWFMGLHVIWLYSHIGTCQESLTLVQAPHAIQDRPHANALQVTKGEIRFDHVTFYYRRNKNVFENQNVLIHPGEKVGLVGFSGSGKTTFVNLLLRYFEIEKGRILIDGQNIREVTQESLRSQIALIPQDITLFHRTLMENIRYGRLDATDSEVIMASKLAHCHEFIENMEEGYETLVGERGAKLSGGQRQRIAIARAILKEAPILILDEATSALDSMTEKYIQDGLHHVMKDRTALVIAHRLATLSDMDRILVFKGGQIVEEGSHHTLLKKQGHYAALWQMQVGGFLPESQQIAKKEAVSAL